MLMFLSFVFKTRNASDDILIFILLSMNFFVGVLGGFHMENCRKCLSKREGLYIYIYIFSRAWNHWYGVGKKLRDFKI
ncbi:hypothetical protein BDZ91DRAFT_290643 [Kalaharituber pfeilii]|nr:hypothetical protein BDZ91DRAFT_290643 [Kalaharituber pfeilii]